MGQLDEDNYQSLFVWRSFDISAEFIMNAVLCCKRLIPGLVEKRVAEFR